MKNLQKLKSKILRISKLFAIALLGSIIFYSCSNNGESSNTTSNDGVYKSLFTGIRSSKYSSTYYYFYSQDSCFIRYSGQNQGFKQAYVINETGVIIKFDDEDKKYELLGDKVLFTTNGHQSLYKVDDFLDGILLNK